MTQDFGDVAEERDFGFQSTSETERSLRQSRMSGWIPMLSISFTLCCVGLVFSSPAAAMKGTRVT